MGRNSIELTRTDSVCPSPESQLLEYVKNNDIQQISSIVQSNPEIINSNYGHPYYKPILHIACFELAPFVNSVTIITLLELGANLSYSDEMNNNMQALHYAAISGNPSILSAVLRKENINNLSNGNTALLLLVKEGEVQKNFDAYCECVKILLEADIKVNQTDAKNAPAILWAAKNNYKEIVDTIMQCSKEPVDIDSHKLRGKTARNFMEENGMFAPPVVSPGVNNNNNVDVLFEYIKSNDEDAFINFHDIEKFVDADNTEKTLLQMACQKGLTRAVRHLLEKGADPNKTSKLKRTPVEITTEYGYYEIFEMLLLHNKLHVPKMLEIELLKQFQNTNVLDNCDHKRCYEIYLENVTRSDVNATDQNGKSALYYATKYLESDIVASLLKRGASLASKDHFGNLPVHFIDSKTLQEHLDDCLEINLESKIDEENYTATFNYSSLMPPSAKTAHKITNDITFKRNDMEAAKTLLGREVVDLASETEVIYAISQSHELRPLLKHPVITSFLYMKWHRIRWFFYTNFIFYLIFCLSLFLYIFFVYNTSSNLEEKREPYVKPLLGFLCVTYLILFLRELFQIAVMPKKYLFNFENIMDLLLVVVTGLIIFQSPSVDVRKPLSAFVILLSAFVLVLLIGRYPQMYTYIEMLRRVSYNFLKFFMWYSILILAFSFSFYTLFQDDNTKTSQPNNSTETNEKEEEEQDFFLDPLVSLFKTLIMLTGEFDASSINFRVFPLASRIIFILFVIMIAIILLNLLNGLAVSDTHEIKSESELVSYIAMVNHVTSIENLVLGNILPSTLFKLIGAVCCCLDMPQSKSVPRRFTKKVRMFPYVLKNYELSIYPNLEAKVVIPEVKRSNCFGCSSIYLDKITARNTVALIKAKREKFQALRASSYQRNEIILAQQAEIASLREELKIISNKLNYIITNLHVNLNSK